MGTVYQAEHLVMKRAVAIKVINSALLCHPEAVARFLAEVQAAARLDHPNIVKAYDAESIGLLHIFVMEYIEGTALDRLVAQLGPLPVGPACLSAFQAALGLQHAHEQRLTHRDIKPSNLILSAGGKIKILDFGLVKSADVPQDRQLTQVGSYLGTAGYVAPEQAMNAGKADIRSDIYSLGCVVYHLLAGRPPFAGETLFQTILAHLHEPPPSLLQLRGDVPAPLWEVLMRMLAKDPALRFQTPLEVAQALQPFISQGTMPDSQSLGVRDRVAAPTTTQIADATVPIAVATGQPPRLKEKPSSAVEKKETSRRWRAGALVVAALLAGVVVLATVVLRVETPRGTLLVEIDQTGAEVLIDGNQVKIQDRGGRETVQVEVTDDRPHQLKVSKNGFEIFVREFTLKDARGNPIKVALVPKKAAPVAPDSKEAGPDHGDSKPPVEEKKVKTEEESEEEGIRKLTRALQDHPWLYRDNLYPPGDNCRFYPDGTFHRWRWKYWVVGPRAMRIHYDRAQNNPDTGILFTFNGDLTRFEAEFTDPGRRVHKITGMRR
jgi:hypothetical protein